MATPNPLTIWYADRPVFDGATPPTRPLHYSPGTLLPVDGQGGTFTCRIENGTEDVVTMLPNGTLDRRPKGTQGEFEVLTRDPQTNVLRFTPWGIPIAVPYFGR